MKNIRLNRDAVERPLSGAQVALDECLQNVNSGKYDNEAPLVIAIDFERVLGQVCLAWHFRNMTDEEVNTLSEKDHKRLRNTVPNFGFELKLMPGIDCEEDTLGRKFNRAAVALQLSGAKVALDECVRKLKAGDYDEESPVVVAIDFRYVLYKLCLAWHFKNMTDEELNNLSHEEFERLSNTVPNFGFELKLMPGIDPEAGTKDNS